VDPEGAQDRDLAAEEALGRDLERDRGPAEGKRQDLVNSFRLEVMETTEGCLSAVKHENGDHEVESRRACPELVERGRLNLTQDAVLG
jgi:hypothetical protein